VTGCAHRQQRPVGIRVPWNPVVRDSIVDRLEWVDAPEVQAAELLAELAGLDSLTAVSDLVVEAQVAPLRFYRSWKLLRLRSSHRRRRRRPPLDDVYALWRPDRPAVLVTGRSAPIHAINEDEELSLDREQVPDYVRLFFFAVRGDDDAPFVLFEEPPLAPPPEALLAAQDAMPITPAGTDSQGRLLFDTTVVYASTSFRSRIAVATNGEIQMIDDEPLTADFPVSLTPVVPPVGIGPAMTAYLALAGRPPATASARPRPGPRRRTATPPSRRPPIVELVALLLERALAARSANRLVEYFNATLPASDVLERFASMVRTSSPVVIVESNIPFVEEAIASIVNDLLPVGTELPIYRGSVGVDANNQEVLEGFGLPSETPGLVLIPLQVYARAVQVERLAFDIVARDLAAIITCERFTDLPASLRRHTDLVLRLPAVDEPTFVTLFERVMGLQPPARWRRGGTAWVKHVLHTDFEHPRRMQLGRADAFEFIRDQVTERLGAVDPVEGLGLRELHGLGEAREFAEDLIADIHAAMAGRLPWSQVDRGALLVGAPGTGKTTLARAIAKDCGVKFIQGSAATWMAEGQSLGPHIQAIRRTFAEARAFAPAILFIDEIDSLGSREEFGGDRNSIYQTEVVNAVLEQMQGLDPAAPVFVIGATNHEERVDPALRRSGRLDRVIRIPRPNSESLDQIYRHYLAALGPGIAIGPDVDTSVLAGLSVGLTGADVERIVRGAVRRARKAGRAVGQADVLGEITNKPRGHNGSLRLTKPELERTAVHEAGHALALFLGPSRGADIGFVTIVPRDDGKLGFVAPLPDERVHLTRADYEHQLDVFLAGRAAEELTYGAAGISSGAGSDLQNATALVTRMVTQLGVGHGRGLLWSESMGPEDRQVAEAVLADSYQRVLTNLTAERRRLRGLTKAIASRQELSGDEVRSILQNP
jgi:hypothetical protein